MNRMQINDERYGSHLYSGKALAVKEVKPVYSRFVADRDGLRGDESPRSIPSWPATRV